MSEAQNFNNHVRRDVPFLFTALVLFIHLIVTIVVCVTSAIHHRTHHLAMHIWLIVVSLALLVVATTTRERDLRVQNRLIRLEERLRYTVLLPPTEAAAAANLDVRQIVALRFASDTELPALVARTLAENLEPKQIKQSIVTWRPDNYRA